MRKLLTGFAAVSALALFASAAQAECFRGHDVTASTPSEETVAMSTFDGSAPIAVEKKSVADAAATPDCPEGATDCPPANE